MTDVDEVIERVENDAARYLEIAATLRRLLIRDPKETGATMTDLSEKMRTLADGGHPRAEELRAAADHFDREFTRRSADLLIPKKTISMIGAWAAARLLWSECTGEPMI